jgi:putative spermidine/putrescine transport system permease protein
MTRRRGVLAWLWLALPLLYFVALFAVPLFDLLKMGFSKPLPQRVTGGAFSLDNFAEIFSNPLYRDTLWVTLRIGATVALATLALGYPLAFFLARTRSRAKGFFLFLTLSPILISVVVRAYGWIVLLANRGLVNSALIQLGLITRPIRLIFNETGIVIATTHVLLPFMVLAILGSLQSLDPALEDAASSLGASRFKVLRDVTIPLTLPGAAAGFMLVFILGVSSFVTPILLGGQVVLTMPVLALQQFTTAFNWAFGSALTMFLLAAVLIVTLVYDRLLASRLSRGVA